MSITIELPTDDERTLTEQASNAATTPEALARQFVLAGLRGRTDYPRPFAEILAPFRQEVADRGLSDAELDSVFHAAVAESRATKRGAAK